MIVLPHNSLRFYEVNNPNISRSQTYSHSKMITYCYWCINKYDFAKTITPTAPRFRTLFQDIKTHSFIKFGNNIRKLFKNI